MHLCLLAAAVANKGVMMEPVLIDRVASPSGVTRYTRSSRVYHTAMTEGQAAILAEYMRAVVTSGTGTRAAVSGMIICGKTGSAETSLNGRAITNGLFIGFAQDVPYALCVVVEDIDDGQGGGSTAAPIAAISSRTSKTCSKIASDSFHGCPTLLIYPLPAQSQSCGI